MVLDDEPPEEDEAEPDEDEVEDDDEEEVELDDEDDVDELESDDFVPDEDASELFELAPALVLLFDSDRLSVR